MTYFSSLLGISDAASTYAPLISPTFTGSPVIPGYLTMVAAASTYAPLINPTFTGTVSVPTVTAGDNTTKVATTAFVTNAVSSVTAGVSSFNTRTGTIALLLADVTTALSFTPYNATNPAGYQTAANVTSTLGSYALLASPTFTGTPVTPTATVGTNTTQIASTAFVLGQAAIATPLINSIAAVGTSTLFARQDHAHASDTSRLSNTNNLSDLTNITTARTNLGLGGAAVLSVGTTAGTVAAGNDSRIVNALSTTTASSTYAPLASPTFTGSISGITVNLTDNSPVNFNLSVANTGANGGGIRILGNGATTPSKYIRAINGKFQILNNAYTASLLDIDDTGNALFAGSITAGSSIINGTTTVNNTGASTTIDGNGQVNISVSNTSATPLVVTNSSNTVIQIQQWSSGISGSTVGMYSEGSLVGLRYRLDGPSGAVSGTAGNFTNPTNNGIVSAITNSGSYNFAAALTIWSAGGSSRAVMTQDGTLYAINGAYRLGGDGTLSVVASTNNTTPLSISNTGTYNASAALTTWSAGGTNKLVLGQDGSLYSGSAYRLDGTAGTLTLNGSSVNTVPANDVRYQAIGSALNTVKIITTAGAIQVVAGDNLIIINKTTGAATTVNLEANPITGASHTIKDAKGDSATNNITIVPNAGVIDGAANAVIKTNYSALTIIYNGTSWSIC